MSPSSSTTSRRSEKPAMTASAAQGPANVSVWNRRHLALWLMLALTFSTGVVDAVGYLGLDKVFTGNMTGNVVILGMALTGAEGLPVVGPLCALFCFMLGAVIGGRLMRKSSEGWTTRASWLFAAVGFVLTLLAVVAFVAMPPAASTGSIVIAATIGAAMGLQAAGARHIGVKDVTTVVVTSTLTALASESRLAGGKGQPWFRRAGSVIIILAGAAVGAMLLEIHMGIALLLSGALSLAVSVIGHRWLRS